MKYHISVKFVAILLAAVFLSVAACGGVGILSLMEMDLYERTVDEAYSDSLSSDCHALAVELAHRHVSLELGGVPEAYLDTYWGHYWTDMFREGSYFYTIRDGLGNALATNVDRDLTGVRNYTIRITDLLYRKVEKITPLTDAEFAFYNDPTVYYEDSTDPSIPTTSRVENAVYNDMYYDYDLEMTMEIVYTQARLEECAVTVYLLDGALEEEPYWELARLVYKYRYDLFWVLAVALLLFAVCAVYLCCAAGRKPGTEEVKAEGLNRIPLDLYLCAGIVGELVLIITGWKTVWYLLRYTDYTGAIPIGGLLVLAASLLFVGFAFACAAQFKMKQGHWWRNLLVCRFLRPIWRCIRNCFRSCKRFLAMLPSVWQLVLILFGMGAVLLITYLLAFGSSFYRINGFFLLLLLVEISFCVGLFCYGIYAFGVLKKGAAAMAKGDLGQLVPTKHLVGPFRYFAWELNRISGAARRAAEQQMKSERMKTELITNVSHDIKTPLTSIINYVDLLEKPHTEAEGAEYLSVLSRQSQRLKKLVDDLMEMSKASSGNVTVELQRLDAVEAVNQALGEFSDKLNQAGLVPVVSVPETPVYILADGKLIWRVMSNLLSNTVKYALPGTRLYLDLTQQEDSVRISVKNISRDALNISADELAERFVRGDASRNTEGSGLGLNIAASLMELQQGKLEITVDGDLFKASLVFPSIR